MTHLSKLIWALVGGVIAALGSLAVFYLTTKSPELVYEAFPPSHVATTSADVSIYNVRLDNRGNKEATEIQVYLALPNGSFIDDIQVTPTLVAIPHTKERQTDSAFLIHLPSLNAGEGAQFSLLAQRANSAALKVEVRARDASGRERQSDERTGTARYVAWAVSIASIIVGALVAIGGAVLVRDSRIFFQRMFARQLQTLRTQPSPSANSQQSEAQLTTLMLSTTFRFFFNPSISLDKSKIMRFGPNGTILEGNNKKEASWRIRNGLFEFLTAKNQVNSRFYYSPGDRVFYQIPDQDTNAVSLDGIGDQYMMAVATQPA